MKDFLAQFAGIEENVVLAIIFAVSIILAYYTIKFAKKILKVVLLLVVAGLIAFVMYKMIYG